MKDSEYKFRSSYAVLHHYFKKINKKRLTYKDACRTLLNPGMLWTVGTTIGEILFEMERIGYIKFSKSNKTFKVMEIK